MKYFVKIGDDTHEVDLIERLGELLVAVDGEPIDLRYEEADRLGQVVVMLGSESYGLSIEGDANKAVVTLAGRSYSLEIEDERERAAHLAEKEARGGGGPVEAVMPGIVVELLVKEGELVKEGTPMLILEAMKMQNEILAPADGLIATIHVEAGQAVAAGEKLLVMRDPDAD
ncbi:MAG: biotin carboxyl carrier protein [Planctomycetota bacterium]|jgi:biotin carboxyl carrier protein